MARGLVIMDIKFDEVLELEAPHGFLVAQGKETAIARIEPLDADKSYLIVCNGEAFGVANFSQPAQIKIKDFDDNEWQKQHRVTARERRQWWPDSELFYVYRIKDWKPFEGVKLFEDGQVVDEPKLTTEQWQIVSKAKELPKQIILLKDAVSVTDKSEFVINLSDECRELDSILSATYEIDVKEAKEVNEIIPLYSLVLVRNPRMRVSKKSPEAAKKEITEAEIKQEGENMPYSIVRREGEFCVIKDEDKEVMGCHENEEDAEAQLAALRINVEAEESEAEAGMDKPKKRKPRKKELIEADFSGNDVSYETVEMFAEEAKKDNFMTRLKLAAKNILNIITVAEIEEKEAGLDILNSNYGVTQKKVNGDLWHFTWSTNAFEDREKEIFSTSSLKQYVEQANKREDRGFFNFWHMQGTDFAKKEWQMVIGRFLVEAGPYIDDTRGQAAKEFFKQYSDGHPEFAPEGWGCSPEFKYLPEERATGVYENIWITRTSTLPKMAAANIWTETSQLMRSKNMAITDYSKEQIEAAVEVFKDEDFVKSIIQQGETKTAELEAANVAHKGESEKSETEPQSEPQKINMEELAAEVGKQFGANLDPIAEAIATMASGIKELDERLNKLEKEQGIKDKTESPRYVFEWKRASEANETMVTEDDDLKDKKPAETKIKSNDPWEQMGFGK